MIAAPSSSRMQQNDLVISGQKTVPMLVGPTGGKHAMEATATFRVAEMRDNILSLRKLARKGFQLHFGSLWLLDGKRRQKGAAFPGTKLEAHVLERASRPGYVAAGNSCHG